MTMGELEGVYVPGVPKYEPKGMRIWLVLVSSWMIVLPGLAVVARLVCRKIRKQKFWWDDYLIMFSTVWHWAVVAVGSAMFIEGVGYHADTIGPEAIINISRWLLVTEIIYVWNLCWTKLSLLTMYYRIFHFHTFKKWTIAVGAFVVMWAICISFLFTFICVPVQKLWRPELPGRCVSQLGVWLANAGSTIFSDIVILLLPIPQVWKLQLRTYEKIGLTLVFSLGFFAVFASSYRTWVLFNYSKHDISYTLTPLLAWSDIEMSAGIISACLPTMRPIVHLAVTKIGLTRFFKTARSSHSNSKSVGQSSSRDVKRSNWSDSRAELEVPSFVTPQTLRYTAESTRRSDKDNSAFYRLPENGSSGNGRLDGILVETSLEWGLESEGKMVSAGPVEEGHDGPRVNEMSEDDSSSIEMDGVSAATSKSDIPMKRIWK